MYTKKVYLDAQAEGFTLRNIVTKGPLAQW